MQTGIILSTVNNEQLLVSKYVTLIAFILVSAIAVYQTIKFFQTKSKKKKITKAIIASVFILISPLIFRMYLLETQLLHQPKYTTGITTGFCSEFAKGKGISFDYLVKGKKYSGCNTYHPLPVAKIDVPGGKYVVRYAEKYPGKGRMDFQKK